MMIDLSSLKPTALSALRAELLDILGHLTYPIAKASDLPHIEEYELGQGTKRIRALFNAVNDEIAVRDRLFPSTHPASAGDVLSKVA